MPGTSCRDIDKRAQLRHRLIPSYPHNVDTWDGWDTCKRPVGETLATVSMKIGQPAHRQMDGVSNPFFGFRHLALHYQLCQVGTLLS